MIGLFPFQERIYTFNKNILSVFLIHDILKLKGGFSGIDDVCSLWKVEYVSPKHCYHFDLVQTKIYAKHYLIIVSSKDV